jgi:hypothetical protein
MIVSRNGYKIDYWRAAGWALIALVVFGVGPFALLTMRLPLKPDGKQQR